MNSLSPDASLDEVDQYVAELQEKAQKLTEDLTEAIGKARSQDGAVSVAVNASGVLQKLELTNRASEHTPTKLAGLIMSTIAKAQRAVGEQVAEAIESFGGPGGATGLMRQYLVHQPPAEDDDQAAADSRFDAPELDSDTEPTQPPAAPPAAPLTSPDQKAKKPRAKAADDDEEDDEERPW